MIKINLAKRKKSEGAKSSGLDLVQFFSSLKERFSSSKSTARAEEQPTDGEQASGGIQSWRQSAVLKLVVAAIACYLAQDFIQGLEKEELAKIDNKIKEREKEVATVQSKLDSMKGYEVEKQRLEEDEKTIRTKLEVLTRLQHGRGSPAKMLLQISQTVPSDVWLTEFKVSEETVSLAGATVGYSQVSDFLKALSDTSQFKDIVLRGIEENATDKDAKFQAFDIEAKRRKLD